MTTTKTTPVEKLFADIFAGEPAAPHSTVERVQYVLDRLADGAGQKRHPLVSAESYEAHRRVALQEYAAEIEADARRSDNIAKAWRALMAGDAAEATACLTDYMSGVSK